MGWIVGDSFDYYGAIADVGRSVWDSFNNPASAITLVTSPARFAGSQALKCAASIAGLVLSKTFGNEGTVFVALARYRTGALSGTNVETYIEFRDGATAQCTVVFQSNGDLVLKSGTSAGAVLATYAGAFSQDVWAHFQLKVVISNTAGSLTVRKNGSATDTYASATTLDTAGGTANNYANALAIGNGANVGSVPWHLDDVLVYSGAGAAPNDWVGDVRAICLPPTADTATKVMTPVPTTSAQGGGTVGTNFTQTAGTLYCIGPWVATRSGVLTKLTVNFNTALTGHMKMALYAGDGVGGVPGTLLAVSSELTNPGTGFIDFPVAAGPTLVAGRSYYCAYLFDAAPVLMTFSPVPSGVQKSSVARTYAAGFPDPAGTLSAPSGSGVTHTAFTLSGNVTVVSELLANSDTDYVAGLNVNDTDLYDVADLPLTPLAVIGVVTKVFVKKSDAGARSGQVLVKSGATQVAGTDTALGTTYTYLSRVDAVDPATGVAWTAGGVNALQIGQKVTA